MGHPSIISLQKFFKRKGLYYNNNVKKNNNSYYNYNLLFNKEAIKRVKECEVYLKAKFWKTYLSKNNNKNNNKYNKYRFLDKVVIDI